MPFLQTNFRNDLNKRHCSLGRALTLIIANYKKASKAQDLIDFVQDSCLPILFHFSQATQIMQAAEQ